MTNRRTNLDFAALFKKYRLKSEIETLSEFGDLLAEEGYIYENSLFTRWQNAERIPRDRKLLITMLELFTKRGGLQDENEANLFLEAANQRDLTDEEVTQLNQYFHIATQTLPEQIDIFIGREEIIKDVTWMLLNKKKVLLYGPPGVGKTAIGIRIGHLLKDKFPDGVFWYRPDIKKSDIVIDEILRILGIEDNSINTFDKKIKKLNSIAKNKNILLILDNFNIESSNNDDFLHFLSLNFAVLTTSTKSGIDSNIVSKFNVPYFNQREYIELAENILGRPYVTSNLEDIETVGTLLGFLPITSTMLLKQIFLNPTKIKMYIDQIKNSSLSLEKMNYDDKNLYTSLEICYKQLSLQLQKVLTTCSIFEGNDFDIKAIAFINNVSIKDTQDCIDILITYSFINLSIIGRYRINPTVRLYLQTKLQISVISKLLVSFYEKLYKREIVGDKVPFTSLNLEIDNILGLIKICFNLGYYKDIILLWQHIHTYLWLSGKWNIILKFDNLMQKTFIAANDQRSLGYYLVDDLGRVNFFQNRIEKALDCLIKAHKIAEKLNDMTLRGIIKQKYAKVYSVKNDFYNAKKSALNAILLLKNSSNKLETIRSFIYYGEICLQTDNFKESLKYLNKAYIVSKKDCIEDTIAMSEIYLGQLNFKLKNYDKAEAFFKSALMIDKKLRRKFAIALAYVSLAKVCDVKEDILRAITLINLAIKIYDELNMKEMSKKLKYYSAKISLKLRKK